MEFGVPQGCVKGPVLYTSYSAPVADAARHARAHDVKYQLYANDDQSTKCV